VKGIVMKIKLFLMGIENNLSNDIYFFREAAKIAKLSLCCRDKCGAVIVLQNEIISSGFNAPPNNDEANRKCNIVFPTANRKKPKSDCTCCNHAEWNAVDAAKATGIDLTGSTLYFTRVDKGTGKIVYSGEPYCTVCSRIVLQSGISFWKVWHDFETIRTYTAKEFNNLSYEFHLFTL
jgi:deoxycytidylate deaminase